MAKSTDAEMEQRVTTVYDLLLLGTSRSGIVQYAAKTWNVESRIVDTYIRRAKTEIRKHARANRTEKLGMARARLEMLFQKALAAKDIRGALAVQKTIIDLEGLNPTPAVKVIRDLGLDEAQLTQLMQLFEESEMSASVIFGAMIEKLSQQKAKP